MFIVGFIVLFSLYLGMSNENYTIQESNLNKVKLYVGISTIGTVPIHFPEDTPNGVKCTSK